MPNVNEPAVPVTSESNPVTSGDWQRRIIPILLVIGWMAGPTVYLKFFCLALLCWWMSRARHGWLSLFGVALFAVFSFAGAFLLNPVAAFVLSANGTPSPRRVVVGIELVLLAMGSVWLMACVARGAPLRADRLMPTGAFAVLWAAILTAVLAPSWLADLAYRGDEVYHVIGIQIRWHMLQAILGSNVGVALVVAWLAAAVMGARFVMRERARTSPILVAIVVGMALLGVAGVCSPWLYSSELLQHPYVITRIHRYPAAESWWGALVGAVPVQNWDAVIFSNETSRILPVLSLFMLGLVFGGDRRWRTQAVPWTCATVAAMITVPNFTFHATILYLELPIVLLVAIVLADSKHWLYAPYPAVCRRWSWWAAVLLGFTKETAVVIVGTLLLVRAVCQFRPWLTGTRGETGSWRRLVSGEAWVWFCVLCPAIVYMGVRLHCGSRPYPAMFANLLQVELLLRCARNLFEQSGLLLPLAMYGGVVAVYQGRSHKLALAGTLFLVMQVFLLCDHAEYAGQARFNLHLMPSILVLGWEGMTSLMRCSRAVGIAGVAAVIAVNAWLSPVNLRGERADWGQIGERWYRWSECFADIKRLNPNARIMLGNMDKDFGHTVVTQQQGWLPQVKHVRPFDSVDPLANIAKTLAEAQERDADFVIFRFEGTEGDMGDRALPSMHGFHPMKNYVSRVGKLTLYVRDDNK